MALRFAAMLTGGFVGGAAAAGYASGYNAQATASCAAAKSKCAFNPSEFQPYKLISTRYETHDTRRFYFALDDAEQTLNMPVSSCIVCKYTDENGEAVVRPYTPTSNNREKGRFELMIKRYPRAKMGNHIFNMKPGEELLIKGPFVKFDYKPNTHKSITMIAGGTGITPMYQVIREVLENPRDNTKVSLIYANNARRDILLANELCEFQKTHNNFHLYLTLLEVPHRWLGGVGYVNEAILRTFLPQPSQMDSGKHKILVCGPPPMMKAISGDKDYSAKGAPKQGELGGLLKQMGYKEADVLKF